MANKTLEHQDVPERDIWPPMFTEFIFLGCTRLKNDKINPWIHVFKTRSVCMELSYNREKR